jgi:V8-like Glu-specific endopeptidase
MFSNLSLTDMFTFRDRYNRPVDPISPIFPILTGNPATREYRMHGTGFFINTFGGFLTAKHVLFNDNGNGELISPFFAITTYEGRHYIRYLDNAFRHPNADIAYGQLRQEASLDEQLVAANFPTPVLQLLENPIEAGQRIRTFAYPRTTITVVNGQQWGQISGEWFEGTVEEILPQRDETFYTTEVIQSNMQVLGGASGGPVMQGPYVIGVNSSGMNLGCDNDHVSWITPARFAHEIEITYKGQTFQLGNKRVSSKRYDRPEGL